MAFPKRKVFVKIPKVNLDTCASILFRLLMRVHHSLRLKGKIWKKWVWDSKSIPQIQSVFKVSWKIYGLSSDFDLGAVWSQILYLWYRLKAITNDVLKFRKMLEFQNLWIAINCKLILSLFNRWWKRIT